MSISNISRISFDASSNIRSAGYDPKTRKLHVEFYRGKDKRMPGPVYEYTDVPPEQWAGMQAAPSAGAYFAAKIKPHASCVLIEAPAPPPAVSRRPSYTTRSAGDTFELF